MNSNPYTVPAFIFIAAVLFGCGAWAFLAVIRQPATGRHAIIPGPGAEGARPAAELQGQPEPPEEITWPGDDRAGRPRDPEDPGPEPRDETWWEQEPPQPPAVEILTGPGAPVPQTSAVTIGVLARVRDALMPAAWQPDTPGEVTFTPAGPDATLTDLRAVPAADAPQYLAAPQAAGQLEVIP